MNLTIVIPYRDNQAGLNALLASIDQFLPVIVVDDCSDHAPSITGYENARVIRLTKRAYFAGAVNAGITECATDVLVCNQDLILKVGWLDGLEKLSTQYAMIGDGVMNHPAWTSGYIQGTFMYLRRDAIDAVGLFDLTHWPLWGGTCEWQLRACRKGFAVKPLQMPNWYQHSRHGEFGSAIAKLLKEQPDKRELFIRTPPLISVVAPCYRHGKYAKDLWESLLAQTFQGFNLTIVDDCSPDDSWQQLQRLTSNLVKSNDNLYEDNWIGLRIMRQKANGGTPVAVNAGIRATRGKYLMVMDGDDMLAPEALEHYLKAMEANPNGLIYSNIKLWKNGNAFSEWRMKPYDFDALTEKNYIGAGVMFSRAAYDQVGGYPEEFRFGRQDWAWAVKMGLHGHCGVWIDEYLYRYRREGQNRVLKNSDPDWMEFFRQQMRNVFPEAYTGRLPMGCCGGRGASRLVKLAVESKRAPAPPSGPASMELIEYVGGNEGRQSYYGEVTGTRYVVGAGRKLIYVDTADLQGMITKMVNHRIIFRKYVPPTVPIIEEAKIEEVKSETTIKKTTRRRKAEQAAAP